jgi:hypothetical protein
MTFTQVGIIVTHITCPRCSHQVEVIDPWTMPRECSSCGLGNPDQLGGGMPGLASLVALGMEIDK